MFGSVNSAFVEGRLTDRRPGPQREAEGKDEVRRLGDACGTDPFRRSPDGHCRAVFAERAEIDGRCHVRLARSAWGPKDERETR
jgi:hypothetical protein